VDLGVYEDDVDWHVLARRSLSAKAADTRARKSAFRPR
jgi:hypothetical protein